MNFKVVIPQADVASVSFRELDNTLGHVNKAVLKDIVKQNAVEGVQVSDTNDFVCESCHLGKMHRIPQKEGKHTQKFKCGECLHVDLCSPMSISLGKSKYFMLVTDRASTYRYVFFLKSKDEASRFLKLLYNRILTALNVKVKMLRCDRGTEFINKNLEQFFEEKGVVIGTSASRCAEQKDVLSEQIALLLSPLAQCCALRKGIFENSED